MARDAFAVWLTGLPASGKSAVAAELLRLLGERGVEAAVLESDALRRVLTPAPRYDEAERDSFYGAMAFVGELLVRHGVNVVFDATAHRRAYRDRVRGNVPRFLEVHVATPLAVCIDRDPKGIYRRARDGEAGEVPGLSAEYEPPLRPDVTIRGERETPGAGARKIVDRLAEAGWLL